jgi:hypothetical protein
VTKAPLAAPLGRKLLSQNCSRAAIALTIVESRHV